MQDSNNQNVNSHEQIEKAALEWANKGFPVLPLSPPTDSRSRNPGKSPLLKEWQRKSNTTEEEIHDWGRRWPGYNLGLVTGKGSGIIAIDVDGQTGETLLAEWSQGDLPPTWEFITPGGGRRFLYQAPAGMSLKKRIKSGGDDVHQECALMGDGQQTVLPPSVHPNGGVYAWIDGHSPDDLSLAGAPAWMVAAMCDTLPARQSGETLKAELLALSALADQCPKFDTAYQLQQMAGLHEEEWILWISMLIAANFSEAATVFSALSTKHDAHSLNRIKELNERQKTAPVAPVRCTTFGCTEDKIRRCFGACRTNDNGEVINSPAAFLKKGLSTLFADALVKAGCEIDQVGNLCKVSRDDNGKKKLHPIANFIPVPTCEIIRDNGAVKERCYEIEGFVPAKSLRLEPIIVPVGQFEEMKWPLEMWGMQANIRAGTNVKNLLREVIQDMMVEKREVIYQHLGWRRTGDTWIYLHAGGCIGDDSVRVEVDERLRRYSLPEENAEERSIAMKRSLRLLQLAPHHVTIPLLALTYLAPMCELLRIAGIEPTFIAWLYGLTGSKKTSLASLFLCHFGDFSSKTPPLSFKDTANSIERRAFDAKDTLLLLDDFHPATNPQEAKMMEKTAQSILRGYGDRISRGRMRQDASLREDFPPRGMLIVTGEDLPSGHSSNARFVGIEIKANEIDLVRLTEAQLCSGELGLAMKGFLEWLAAEMTAGETDALKATFQSLRQEAQAESQHGRLAEAAAWLHIGLDYALRYAVYCGAISNEEKQSLLTEGQKVLKTLSARQGAQIKNERPGDRFLSIVRQLLASGRLHTRHRNWRPEFGNEVPLPSGSVHVGFHDENFYYFMDELIYNEVEKFLRDQHSTISLKMSTLWGQLADAGVITTENEGTSTRYTVKVAIDGKRDRYLKVKKSFVTDESEHEPRVRQSPGQGPSVGAQANSEQSPDAPI